MHIKHIFALPLAALALGGCASKTAAPDPDELTGYLFTYFHGNRVDEEQICYAISDDGFNFRALNDNLPVIQSADISSTGGVRDPHILRRHDDKGFYMVATDMTSSKGWDSNRAMVLMKSPDLVNWESTVINIQDRYEGHEDLKRVWAPQTIYDPEAGKYMVYWSMQHGDGPDIIYYAYANDDFTDFEGEPKPLFLPENGKSCIDGDIVYKDGLFHLFYKTEGHGNGIKKATTQSLTSGKWTEGDDYKQQTDDAVEGSGIFKLIGSDKYILMYDVYMKGRYEFCETTDLENFDVIADSISMDFHPRHGTVIPITRAEKERLLEKWPSDGLNGHHNANPVLPGWHADPEILHSANTGKYYIYSTTDGTPGWGGTALTCYSSDNLTDWTDEGVILDLATDQVPWADGNAWAPAIEEKMIDGKYKYFFYYSGNPVAGGGKQIGVATADSPVGPFTDLGHAIVTESPAGGGQQIDVDVFTDPASGKSYLYWGNGYMAGAEFKPSMTEIDPATITVMTPEGGSLETYAYREAPYVFCRDGRYYFMWSVDDTGSPNYHVAYGTSASPLGPIAVAEQPVILSQDAVNGIFGPAHNSVVELPDGTWRIVYHRINPAYLHREPGIHRQVCIDELTFAEDGTVNPVVPTR